MATFELGDWVLLSHDKHQEGIILYIGSVPGHKDTQYGIELTDFTVGEHHGTYQNKQYFESKDKETARGIFVSQSQIQRKMNKSDFQNTQRLQSREKAISSIPESKRQHIHTEPLLAKNTIDIIHLLGKYWLRYVCLLLPTLDKFKMPRVCKTFHLFVTLEIGNEDTPDPPPYDAQIYNQFVSMQLLIDADPEHARLNNSTTDEADLNYKPAVQTPTPSPEATEKTKSSNEKKKKKRTSSMSKNKKNSKTESTSLSGASIPSISASASQLSQVNESKTANDTETQTKSPRTRGLNEEEQFLWEQLCKTDAMVKYVDGLYEARMDIFLKMRKTMKQANDVRVSEEQQTKQHQPEITYYKDGTGMLSSRANKSKAAASLQTYRVLTATREYKYILWIFACPLGDEHQALDLETRKLITAADEQAFYQYVVEQKLYRENLATLNLYNKRFLKRSPFELNLISYFLTFQNKLIEIYNGNHPQIPGALDESYYNDGNDDFYLIVSNLLNLDASMNDAIANETKLEETESTEMMSSKIKLYHKCFGGGTGIAFLRPILASEYSALTALELTKCGLCDDDLHQMCVAFRGRSTHSRLQTISLAENPSLSDAYMDEFFEVIGSYLGNVMCLMLHDTGITDETCATIFNFYKSQFSKANIKNDQIGKEIIERYNVDNFKKELQRIQETQTLSWQHKDEEVKQFMLDMANDYGVIHKYYPELMEESANEAKWEELYQRLLSANNFVMNTEIVMEAYERQIQWIELQKEQELQNTPKLKRRSKLKQLRLHLNAGITRIGYSQLNDIFKKQYIHKKDGEAVILIDGNVDDFSKIQQYKQWLEQCQANRDEFESLGEIIKEMDGKIKNISNQLISSSNGKLSNEVRTSLVAQRRSLMKEKEKLINRRFELNDLINEAKREPLVDPKRDAKWDKRLMTDWSHVWDQWIDVTHYKNFI